MISHRQFLYAARVGVLLISMAWVSTPAMASTGSVDRLSQGAALPENHALGKVQRLMGGHKYGVQEQRFRSRREVINEVEARYDAKVIRIRLDRAEAVYRVRMLLNSGKVRNITVDARR